MTNVKIIYDSLISKYSKSLHHEYLTSVIVCVESEGHSKDSKVCTAISTLMISVGDYINQQYKVDIIEFDFINVTVKIDLRKIAKSTYFESEYISNLLKLQEMMNYLKNAVEGLSEQFSEHIKLDVVNEV